MFHYSLALTTIYLTSGSFNDGNYVGYLMGCRVPSVSGNTSKVIQTLFKYLKKTYTFSFKVHDKSHHFLKLLYLFSVLLCSFCILIKYKQDIF